MKIGELAARTGQTTETIRYYEKIGLLLPAERLDNNYRVYSHTHVKQLDFIRRCRTLGISIDEIRCLMDNVNRPSATVANETHRLIHGHLEMVEHQIAELEELRQSLLRLDALCQGGHHEGESCGLVNALSGEGNVAQTVIH